jgi:hypothetical protein
VAEKAEELEEVEEVEEGATLRLTGIGVWKVGAKCVVRPGAGRWQDFLVCAEMRVLVAIRDWPGLCFL